MSELFAGTAWHYARYRPGYPSEFLDELVRRFHLDGTGRLLDLGCGTGQLTVPLASHVRDAVGVDPEPQMLVEAAAYADRAGAANLTWVNGSSEDLPQDAGRFDLVTMGRSFHWMNREQVLNALHRMVEDHGGVAIANDSCLVRPVTDWQQAIEEIQTRFVPTHGPSLLPGDDYRSHAEVLGDSPFPKVGRQVYQFEREWTVEHVIGYLYSTSMPLRRLLANQRGAFEHAVTTTLADLASSGPLIEPVTLDVYIATRH